MIIISGQPLDISEIIDEYQAESIERQLLETMSSSADKYRYDSIDQLKFELDLRREIVNAAKELYRSRLSFSSFQESRCNPEYWERTNNGGFLLKQGALPSEAINDIFINGREYATECATAMLIVYYKALLNVFKQDAFNKTFSEIYMMNWHDIDPILGEIGTPRKAADILLGDRGYFVNPDVDPQTPEWQGENVIVLPHGMYYGHGIGIENANNMIEELNNNRKRGATRSAYLMDAVGRPNFKRLAEIYFRAV